MTQELSTAERAAIAMREVFGETAELKYSFSYDCPEDLEGLEREKEKLDKALEAKAILEPVAVAAIKARHRLVIDKIAVLQSPAFSKKPPKSQERERYDALLARIKPLDLETEWLDRELERLAIPIGTLAGLTQEKADEIGTAIAAFEAAWPKKDEAKDGSRRGRRNAGAKKDKKEEPPKQESVAATPGTSEAAAAAASPAASDVLTKDESDVAWAAYNFLRDQDLEPPAEFEQRLLAGAATSNDFDALTSAAMDMGWVPELASAPAETETAEAEPVSEIPFIAESSGTVKPEEVSDLQQKIETPETNRDLETKESNDVTSAEPGLSATAGEGGNHVDAEALPAESNQKNIANSHQDSAGQPVQLPAAQVQETEQYLEKEDGTWVNLKDGTVLTEEQIEKAKLDKKLTDAEVFLFVDSLEVSAYEDAVKVLTLIKNWQHDCEDIAKIARDLINAKLRLINGFLYRFNRGIRAVFEPKLKKNQEGEYDPKNVKVLDAGVKLFWTTTGGVKCVDRKGLNGFMATCSDAVFEGLGGTYGKPQRVWEYEKIVKLYEAGEESLQRFFTKSDVNELGLMRVGVDRSPWTPARIGKEFKIAKNLPMLTTSAESEQEESTSGTAA